MNGATSLFQKICGLSKMAEVCTYNPESSRKQVLLRVKKKEKKKKKEKGDNIDMSTTKV